jgi:hypothetical protein
VEAFDVGFLNATLPVSLPLRLIKGLPCAQLPGLGGTRPRVRDLEKPIFTAKAEASRAKLKDENKKAKV